MAASKIKLECYDPTKAEELLDKMIEITDKILKLENIGEESGRNGA